MLWIYDKVVIVQHSMGPFGLWIMATMNSTNASSVYKQNIMQNAVREIQKQQNMYCCVQ